LNNQIHNARYPTSNIAIIPARGGSKRIPRKNIKDFLGKPIIAYSIEAALNSKLFDEVMVSTDDNEIVEISKKFGATIPFLRSEKTADDYSTTADVLTEVLKEYKKLGKVFDYLCCIYPAAPFVTSTKLNDSFDLLIKSSADLVIPVVKFSYPVQRSLMIEYDKLKYVWPENQNKRSQDIEPMYHDAGQFYWTKTEAFLKNKSLLSDNTIPYIVPETEVQDIDNKEDWKLTEMKYLLINRG
jgi:N-acylneuraminate cytidylyltransferase